MGSMSKQYSSEFKMEAVKRVERTGEPVARVAADLDVKTSTLHGWIKNYRKPTTVPFPGSGHLTPEDERIRRIEKENRELREENEILKKAAAYFAKNQK